MQIYADPKAINTSDQKLKNKKQKSPHKNTRGLKLLAKYKCITTNPFWMQLSLLKKRLQIFCAK